VSEKIHLDTLLEIEKNPSTTQRTLSRKLNISLGLTNVILKNLIKRGWIKVQKLTGRKILYLITPQGMTWVTNLLYDRFRETQHYYQQTKILITAYLDKLYQQGVREVAIYGTNQLSEITYLSLLGSFIKLHYFITGNSTPDQKKFLGQEVLTLSDFFQEMSQKISEMPAREKLSGSLVIISTVSYRDKGKEDNQASKLDMEIKRYKNTFPHLKIKIIDLEDILKKSS